MQNKTLKGNDKIIVWVANIINPVLAGFLFYYMWKKEFPDKAKQANNISLIVFSVELLGFVVYKLFINPA